MAGSTGQLTRTPVSGCSEKVSDRNDIEISNGSAVHSKIIQKNGHETSASDNVTAPDGGWGWAVLFGTMLVNVVVIGHAKSFGVYFKNLMEEFDSTPSKVALLQAINFSMFSFLSPVASILSQWLGPRKVALIGGITACFGLIISAYTPNMAVLYLSYGVIQGVSLTFTFTPGITMIAKYFNKRRGLANGLAIAGNALGGMIIPFIVGYLLRHYGLRGCFLIMGGVLLHVCVGAMLWQPVELHQKKLCHKVLPVASLSVQEPPSPPKMYNKVQVPNHYDSPVSFMKHSNYDISDDSPTSVDYLVAECHKPSASEPDISSHYSTDLEDYINGYANREKYLSSVLDCKTTYTLSPFHHQTYYSNGMIQRNSSSPHLGEHLRVVMDRTLGSNSTESLPIMRNKFSTRLVLLQNTSKTSSFTYLSSYNLGPTAGAVLTKEHFTEVNGDIAHISAPRSPSSNSTNKHFVGSIDGQKKKRKHRWKWLLSHVDHVKIDKVIFQKSRFYVMTVSLFFHILGYPGTLMFLPLRATNLGFSEAKGASLLSVLALSDLIGRICCAWLSDFHFCPRKYWFIGGMLMSGLIAFTLPLYETYVVLVAGTAGFGFCCGAYIGLVVVMFADVYGPERVALAYSISTVTGGFMALGGPPFMGYILETTNSYTICQSILGAAQIAGASVWIIEPWAIRYEQKKAAQRAKASPEEEQLV